MREIAPWSQVVTALPRQIPAAEQENDRLQAEGCARADAPAPAEDDIPYQLLVEHANDAIVILQNGRVVYQNTAHMAMLGYPTVELAQRDFLACVAPEDRQRVAGYYQRRLHGEPVPEQYTVSSRVQHRKADHSGSETPCHRLPGTTRHPDCDA